VATALLVRLPPLYDYYHGLFEGLTISRLWFSAGAARSAVAQDHTLLWRPIPNLAAPVLMALLQQLLAGLRPVERS